MSEKAKITAVMNDNQNIEIKMRGNTLDIGYLLANVIEKVADEDDTMLFGAVTSGIYCSKKKDALCRGLAFWLKKEGSLHD